MEHTLRISGDHRIDFADHMTKLRNFTKGEIREFSAFSFSRQLIIKSLL